MADLKTDRGVLRALLADAIRAHHLFNGRCVACGEKAMHQSLHQADVLLGLSGVAVTLKNRCRCGCGESWEDHLCPCGCGHTYEEAVRNVMGGPMFLSWDQAEANIDEHPDVPCKWTAAAGVFSEGATND